MREAVVSEIMILVMVILLIPYSGPIAQDVDSEHEPNDSFSEAERIGEGTISGQVSRGSYYYPEEGSNDTDVFMISVPARKMLHLSIVRKPENGAAVFVTAYNWNHEKIDDFYLFGQPTGEKMVEQWFNKAGSSRYVYLNLSGEGSYSLTVKFRNDFNMAFISTLSVYSLVVLFFGIMIGLILGTLLAERQRKRYEKNMLKWESIRKKGKWRFILIYGVILWGFLTALTFSLITLIIDPYRPVAWILIEVFLCLVAFSIGGIVFGIIMWRSNEKGYLDNKEKVS